MTTTPEAIFAAVAREAKDWRRPHLGASVLGRGCDRAIWYSFRWVQNPAHGGQLLALFEHGDLLEAKLISRLRATGAKVWSVDPETGKQFRVELAPHIGGSADTIVVGLPEAPEVTHIVDVKSANEKNFAKLDIEKPREWKLEYWVQQQLYMLGLDIKWAALLVINKNDDDLKLTRFPFDESEAKRYLARGVAIVEANSAPGRISENPSWWACKFCDYLSTCQLGQVAKLQRNCRTCVSSTPKADGTWYCEQKHQTLTVEDQKKGCGEHLFLPSIMPRGWNATDGDEAGRWIKYETPAGEKVDRAGMVQ